MPSQFATLGPDDLTDWHPDPFCQTSSTFNEDLELFPHLNVANRSDTPSSQTESTLLTQPDDVPCCSFTPGESSTECELPKATWLEINLFGYEEEPILVSKELNPNAPVFVPTKSNRARALAPEPATSQKPAPPWLATFNLGACTSREAHEQHVSQANRLVTSFRWADTNLDELAQQFTSVAWQPHQQPENCNDGLSPFALQVFRTFHALGQPENAQAFLWHMRERVLGVFNKWWDSSVRLTI